MTEAEALKSVRDILANTFDVHVRDERDGSIHILNAQQLHALQKAIEGERVFQDRGEWNDPKLR